MPAPPWTTTSKPGPALPPMSADAERLIAALEQRNR
jgi:hypothetical protein